MRKSSTSQKALTTAAIIVVCAMAMIGGVKAQGAAQPDFSGNYRCQPDPSPCLWSGQTPSMSQSGNKLEIKNDKGETSDATLTSGSTISAGPTFNSYGVIRSDKSIDWSNGTKWLKQ